jgi:hypothetical protein
MLMSGRGTNLQNYGGTNAKRKRDNLDAGVEAVRDRDFQTEKRAPDRRHQISLGGVPENFGASGVVAEDMEGEMRKYGIPVKMPVWICARREKTFRLGKKETLTIISEFQNT